MAADPLRGAWLAHRLHPARVLVLPRVRSTNLVAAEHLEAGNLRPPAIVSASRQTAGRGQRENRWWSDGGSLCATLLLPVEPDQPVGAAPLRAGLAVASVLATRLPGCRVQVKWPNDILVGYKKIAGLLCARLRDTDLIGIGLNVFTDLRAAPQEISSRATTLLRAGAKRLKRDELLAEIWCAVKAERSDGSWIDRFNERHFLHHQPIRLEHPDGPMTGVCRGVDEQGRLLLETSDGMRRITEGTPGRMPLR